MVVYLDVIWLLNLLVDSMLLWLTSILLKRRVKWWRIGIGGLIGSILIFLPLTPIGFLANNAAIKIFFSLVMVFSVFGFSRMKSYFSCLMTFYFTTFLLGGILIGTHYLLSFQLDYSSSLFLASIKGFGDPISWIFVMFGIPAAWYFSRKRIETFEMAKIEYEQLVKVSIEINHIHMSFNGLIDSGNKLYDPISNMPVMIASIIGQQSLPKEIIELAKNPDGFMDGSVSLSEEWTDKLRFIPAKSVGKSNQLLTAFKPDRLVIFKGDESWVVKKGLISFTDQTLSGDGEFNCIVHPKMVSGISIKTAS
ncbi:sigma-E processing peptidase SpoIIGA [Falsibacillus pallidus]|uniref:sigma-E processing peptidase SpoIIGA n=1 Tax=Falsibacillus pallidus TaxID=493781 RepID=UPI003D962755